MISTIVILCIIIATLTIKLLIPNQSKVVDVSSYTTEIAVLKAKLDVLTSSRVDPSKVISLEHHNSLRNKYELALSAAEVQIQEVSEKYQKVNGKQKSEQVRLGIVAENLAPILTEFPYDSTRVRGLFNPIDFVVFEDTKVIFVEFKTGNAKLSQKQRNIKKLIDNGMVTFETHRMNNGEYTVEGK